LIVDADIGLADVVAHDDENVRPLLLRLRPVDERGEEMKNSPATAPPRSREKDLRIIV